LFGNSTYQAISSFSSENSAFQVKQVKIIAKPVSKILKLILFSVGFVFVCLFVLFCFVFFSFWLCSVSEPLHISESFEAMVTKL